jgi:hypothetical protein
MADWPEERTATDLQIEPPLSENRRQIGHGDARRRRLHLRGQRQAEQADKPSNGSKG